MHRVLNTRLKIKNMVLNLAVLLYLFTFMLFYAAPVEMRKIYYLAGYLTFFVALLGCRSLTSWKNNRDIAGATALFGLTLLGWYALNFTHSEYWSIYDSYKETGKVLLISALIVFLVSNLRFSFPAERFSWLLIVAGLATNAYAIYQGLEIESVRLQIELDRATVIAYIFTMTNIVMLAAILELKSQYRYFLFLLAALSGFAAIAYTETRAALLTFPVLIILLLIVHPRVRKKQLLKLGTAFIVMLALLAIAFHQKLTDRYQGLRNDVSQYQDNNSVSSIGSRLAMFQSGLQAALDAPFGESAERRNDNIKRQVEKKPKLTGALDYMDVHMHNELIENFSLRGVGGVITLIIFYATLLINAWRKCNVMQGMLTLSVIIYGLSDVIFFGKEAVIIFSTALILSILYQKIVIHKDENHE
ncbi:TPA: O-antigen ligase family protein [Klebsiella pneumoniae]|uniref:O-antigen ligase family protein n=1 Tax=Klebsiella pneumoniae TaxID=573 RepID=UPI001581E617|nr:O-antigen ligase family protein [Klebsiella pneumoniae]HDU3802534.1 O-antigen ligase family protein [Klebsiella pneumoniae subsp. pneumoniae]MCD9702446.1 O-antigen ligase family protein [Klebsiella pneumoniae]UHL84986.1 O-antigen ligase family protein [Klebsiella pneumoniae]WJT97921.1 O-antigen ligase family protein [Klebsiella pneumoniae]HBQ6676435.1 O-antigen ligase family protein [Klebsiella pneumoniae]